MAILRGDRSRAGTRVRAEDKNNAAQARAEQVVEAAQRQREAMLEEAREQCEVMLRDAVEQGRQEGFLQADHMRQEIKLLEQRMVGEVDGEIVRTALSIAEHMLETEFAARPTALVDLCTTALATARDARDVSVRVHPRSAGILRKNADKLVSALGRAREVQIREDRKVKPGGVLIQTESGVIDAQLDTQLEELALALDV